MPEPMRFEEWRSRYASMSDAEQRVAYDGWAAAYPDQDHANKDAVERFLDMLPPDLTILEVGGWKGTLAAAMLPNRSIARWANVEFCGAAAAESVCADPRYDVIVPDSFRWWRTLQPGADVLIAMHVIEHLRAEDTAELLGSFVGRWIILEAPIPDHGPVSWEGYPGSHILEWGWVEVERHLRQVGYQPLSNAGDCRMYVRGSHA